MYRLELVFYETFLASMLDDGFSLRFCDRCRELYGDSVLVEEQTDTHCVLFFNEIPSDEVVFRDELKSLLSQVCGCSPEPEEVSLILQPAEPSSRHCSKTDKESRPSAAVQIEALIGATEFKKLARELCDVAPAIVARKTQIPFACRSYLFAIGKGGGYTTCLNLFAQLIQSLELFSFSRSKPEVQEFILLAPTAKQDPFAPLKDALKASSGKKSLISIDIGEWISSLSDPRFRDFLAVLEDYSENNIYVFRVPFLENETLQAVKRQLSDVLYIRAISFPPLSMEELCQCASRTLASYRCVLSEDAIQVFQDRVQEEKSDGRFYGMNTVNKIVYEMIYRKHLADAARKDSVIPTSDEELLITAQDIQGLASVRRSERSAEEDLMGLVGLDEVKATILEIVNQLEAVKHQAPEHRPSVHMCFTGNPGTGKTTVARIVGRLLKERGLLRNGNYFEFHGRALCGAHVGETFPKTMAICRDAYGSVLFIDEAYSLYHSDASGRDYGREVLDTLVAEMENHRSDFVVIMAGYKDEMDILLSQGNLGLDSRITYQIHFPNYSREELCQLFFNHIGSFYRHDSTFDAAVIRAFSNLPDETLQSREFSNARFVRNLFERTCGKALCRQKFESDTLPSLTVSDFEQALDALVHS